MVLLLPLDISRHFRATIQKQLLLQKCAIICLSHHQQGGKQCPPGGWREDSLNLWHGSNCLTRDDTLACLPQCLALMHREWCSPLLLLLVEGSQLCQQAYYSLHYPEPNTSWMFYKLMEKVCAVKWKFVKSLMGNFGNQIGIDSSSICSLL